MTEKKTKARMVRVSETGEIVKPETLRVLMMSVTGEMGGAERSFLDLLRALPRDRIQPVVCVPPGTPLERLCAGADVPVLTVHLRRFRRTTNPFVMAGQVKALYQGSRAICDICAARSVDLVHANTDSAALVAWEVARISKTPFVWHSRDLIPMHGFARILSAASAAVVAISQTVERHLLKEGVSPEKLLRIDNGIDLSRIPKQKDCAGVRERIRGMLGIEAGRPVVLCVGSYVPWKKLDLFIDTMAAVRARVPNVVGLLAGSGLVSRNEVYEHLLRDRAQALKLDDDNFRFLGERDDVPELMAASDVVVSCSENEPFGRVVAEAGATGVPVVSTSSGGKTEIVEHNVTGLLAASGNRDELAEACARLLMDADLRSAFGAAARARIERLYDVQRTAGAVTALYESIAGHREARHA